jgi:uncharacterized protein (UPF0147 family)
MDDKDCDRREALAKRIVAEQGAGDALVQAAHVCFQIMHDERIERGIRRIAAGMFEAATAAVRMS